MGQSLIQRPERNTLKENRVYMSTKDDTGTRSVVVSYGINAEGFSVLTCSCDHYIRKYWCKHIIHIYGDELKDRQLPQEHAMYIDLFIKQPLMIPVVVSPVEDPDGPEMAGIHVLWGDVNFVGGEYRSASGEVIGYLSRPTRATIRHMILDWIPSKLFDLQMCKASTHTQGDSVLDVMDPVYEWHNLSEGDRRNTIRDIWIILDSKKCVKCLEASMVPF